MATITLTFPNKINESAQVGDTAYYTPTTDVGDFKTSLKADEVTENTYIQKDLNITFGESKIIYFHNNAILFSEGNLNFKGTKKKY